MKLLKTSGYLSLADFGITSQVYLHGLDVAKEMFMEGVSRGLPIVLKGDPDVDGLLAWAVASEMLKSSGYQFTSIINTDRRHGLVDEEFVETDDWQPYTTKYSKLHFHKNELIINVDSSISSDEMFMLAENGNIVISLDHHEVELSGLSRELEQQVFSVCEDNKMVGQGIIINNQYSFEPEEYRFWSGTGVVINALSYILNVPVKREWIAMHGVTLLSDVRDIENDLAHEILGITYGTPLSSMPTLRKLAKISQVEVPEVFQRDPQFLDRTFIDYSLSPYINASYQLNLGEVLFRLVDDVGYRLALPAKTVRRKIVDHLKNYIHIKDYPSLTVIMIRLEDIEPLGGVDTFEFKYTSFLGLVANSYLSLGKTVFIGATHNGKWVRGSVRGYHQSLDYQTVFASSGFVCKGHKGAFGITAIKFKPSFKQISYTIDFLERTVKGISFPVVESKNLLKDMEKLKDIALQNEYSLSSNFIRVVYLGSTFSVKNESKGKIGYDVNGLYVDSYDKSLDLKNAYIIPTMVDEVLTLTLRKDN